MDNTKTKKKEDLYFKNYDLYSDANKKDTIRIKYKTLEDVKSTIKKLEKIYKNGSKPHTRISKIANVLNQRLRVIDSNSSRYRLSNRYFEFLKKRTKLKNDKDRKKLVFKI
jgi:hypothetical protein